MHEILGDFEIQTDQRIPARRPELVRANKKENLPNNGSYRIGGPLIENKRKQSRDKFLDLARKLKERMGYEGDGDSNCSW